jgi:asparagine synthase (glutamine-hydrolysing)
LITRDNVERLGFVEWPKVVGLVDRAFGPEKDRAAMRTAITVAQWIVLSQRLGIARAEEFLWDWVMDKGHNT